MPAGGFEHVRRQLPHERGLARSISTQDDQTLGGYFIAVERQDLVELVCGRPPQVSRSRTHTPPQWKQLGVGHGLQLGFVRAAELVGQVLGGLVGSLPPGQAKLPDHKQCDRHQNRGCGPHQPVLRCCPEHARRSCRHQEDEERRQEHEQRKVPQASQHRFPTHTVHGVTSPLA